MCKKYKAKKINISNNLSPPVFFSDLVLEDRRRGEGPHTALDGIFANAFQSTRTLRNIFILILLNLV